VAPPAVPSPPGEPSASGQSGTETGCIGVRVIGYDGQPMSAAKVMFISALGADTKRTGPNGICNSCGLPVGAKVSVMVFGPDGIPTSRKLVVNSGRTGIEIKLGKPMQRLPGIRPDESFTPPGVRPGRRMRRDPPPVKNGPDGRDE
jgi:hypothetical protein